MARVFPVHSRCWRVTHLLRDDQSAERSQQASRRLLELVPGLPDNSMLTLVMAGNGQGQVGIEVHTDIDSQVTQTDIEWVFDKVALIEPIDKHEAPLPELSKLASLFELAGVTEQPSYTFVGFQLVDPFEAEEQATHNNPRYWPIRVLTNSMDLLGALTTCEAQVRVHLAPANEVEHREIGARLRDSAQLGSAVNSQLYLGSPVRIHSYVGTSDHRLPPRLRAALLKLGVGLRLHQLPLSSETIATWDGEEASLAGAAQPFGKAQCLVTIPASGPAATICGVKTREAQLDVVPLTDTDLDEGLRLGLATDELGQSVDVHLGVGDMLLHTQVLGSTGTGKSSLLAGLVRAAIQAGYGVTVLDAHGPLVDRLLVELPASAVERTIAVHSDDLANPVPVNVMAAEDSDLILDTMLAVLGEIFDPRREGIVGPRFERITSQIIKAQQALLGSEANFAALPLWLRDQATLKRMVDALKPLDAGLASAIHTELANTAYSGLGDTIAWVNSKFQRMISSAEMRAITLTGEDAIDVTQVIDERQILLVNLASTAIGRLGAQFLGEMWLLKHWLAMSQRRDVTRPHLIVVDEAQLFSGGILPRMLAEARKFGLGIVMAHQHLEQLGTVLREAALANTSNVIVFKSGPAEALSALARLGTWPSGPLTRLPRLTAAATLSSNSRQTEPFTLVIDHNERVASNTDDQTAEVLRRTHASFVDPYRDAEQWTMQAVDDVIRDAIPEQDILDRARSGTGNEFLDKWLEERKKRETPDDH